MLELIRENKNYLFSKLLFITSISTMIGGKDHVEYESSVVCP